MIYFNLPIYLPILRSYNLYLNNPSTYERESCEKIFGDQLRLGKIFIIGARDHCEIVTVGYCKIM